MNREIVEYEIVNNHSLNNIRLIVSQMLQEGRQPLGGVSVEVCDGCNWYIQAMVKYSPSQNYKISTGLVDTCDTCKKPYVMGKPHDCILPSEEPNA